MNKQFKNNSIEHLYIHVPFCKHLCNYCDFYKHLVSDDQVTQFESYLTDTFSKHQELLNKYDQKIVKLKSLYLGGGTPSLWDGANLLKNLFNKNNLKFDEKCEFTLELDPGAFNVDSFLRWIDFGVNRVSIGSQSMDQKFIEKMDRSHSLFDTKETIKFVSKHIKNFSVDLMLGLPESKGLKRDIIKELKMLLDYNPTHVSLYILKSRKNYIHSQQIPSDEYIEEEYLVVCDYLESVGLKQYEVSNFSIRGFESVHNMAYWKYKAVAALGPSATGLILVDKKAFRYKWKPKTQDYILEKLNENEILLEKIYLNMRCILGIDAKILNKKSEKIKNLFSHWQSRSLATFERDVLKLNPRGYIIQDCLMDELFNFIDF